MEEAFKILIMVDVVIWLIGIFGCLEYWRKSKRQKRREVPTEPSAERVQEPSPESESEPYQEVNEMEIEGKIIKRVDIDDSNHTYYVQPEGENVCYRFDEIEDTFTVGDLVKGDTDDGTLTLSKIKSDIDGFMIEVKPTNQ
jgi:hypothetical protein